MKKIFTVLFMVLSLVFFSVGCTPEDIESIIDDVESIVDNIDENTDNSDVEKHGPYSVVRVVDGDTIIVNIDGKDERVRMIGVNTPESVHPDKDKNTANGKTASEFTKNLLTNEKVYLEYDVERTDRYGRILAYVYRLNGEMVNELLLKEGMATTMKIKPNVKYAEKFYELETEAEKAEKGFWCK